MSQALQQNGHLQMVRHQNMEAKAQALTPALFHHDVYPQGVVSAVQDAQQIHGWRADVAASVQDFFKQDFFQGEHVIIDFGKHCVGYLEFACEAAGSPPDAPAHLQFIFGETLAEVVEPFSDYSGWLSSSWLQQQDCYLDELPHHMRLPRRYCCRFLRINVVALSRKFQLRFTSLKLDTVTSASLAQLPTCSSNDKQLQRIDEVAVHTLKNCMHDVFEDGPKRDRRLWLGDLRLQALVNDVTVKNYDLVKRCLYLFAAMTREDGMVSANIFVKPQLIADDTFLFDYALFFVDVLQEYVAVTDDRETLAELWSLAWRQIELALERVAQNGIVRDSADWWSFIDWHEELNKQAASQGVLIYCLSKALILARDYDVSKVSLLEEKISWLKAAAQRELWDAQSGFYTSGESQQVSCASQVWMVLADVGTPEKQRSLLKRLKSHPPKIQMNTPYMMHHYVAALLQVNEMEQATQEIKNYWGAMLEYGADTFWELFDPKRPDFSPYGSKLINSYCHAWSCTPSWFIRKYLL
ncbi:sugar hydrolase [Buttiauxella warmboldiae]|uniref:Sugar hydrolase n=1 Tax=Buttiauxella warmboldiae TaxID=82993 RepID=A0A3N5DU68_9ENTR|nr:family 78 glycoside hydrolase catalytic domain [Buttiauxella warmboldiae]RPH29160.1 sugar hydrolase [Buttiauxella warmboldiae]